MCLPLVLCGFYLIYMDHNIKKNWFSHAALTAFGLTGIIQSHVLSVEMAAIFILFTCLILIKKTVQLPRFLTLLSAAVFSVLLNLGFLVPFLSYFDTSININSPGVLRPDTLFRIWGCIPCSFSAWWTGQTAAPGLPQPAYTQKPPILLESYWLSAHACSCFWSIKELFEQRDRVKKGWFPENPNRKDWINTSHQLFFSV